MEAGKQTSDKKRHLIVEAIQVAERGTTGEIHVHLTRRFFDPHPLKRATKLFFKYGLQETRERNAVLLYINARLRRMSIYGDIGVHAKVGDRYWDDVMSQLRWDLQSTFLDRAVSWAVIRIGATLAQVFPSTEAAQNPDELSNEVTED